MQLFSSRETLTTICQSARSVLSDSDSFRMGFAQTKEGTMIGSGNFECSSICLQTVRWMDDVYYDMRRSTAFEAI